MEIQHDLERRENVASQGKDHLYEHKAFLLCPRDLREENCLSKPEHPVRSSTLLKYDLWWAHELAQPAPTFCQSW
jgi:hypothetical protein